MILADNQVGTLAAAFLTALVIVAPFGYVHVRRVLRARPRPAPDPGEAVEDASPATSSGELGAVVGRITAAADDVEPGEEFEVAVPAGATIGGRPADPAIVASIIADGLRRGGIEILERGDRTWRCRRAQVDKL